MDEIRKELVAQVNRAKAARNALRGIQSASSLAAMDIAETLADLGQRFHILSIKLKQAAREEAQHDAEERGSRRTSKHNAAKLAAEMRRRGYYSVQP